MRNESESLVSFGRRAFLKNGVLVLAAATVDTSPLFAEEQESKLRVGLVTDLHYADKPPAGSRHYRETPDKLAGFQLTGAVQIDAEFAIEIGNVFAETDGVLVKHGDVA